MYSSIIIVCSYYYYTPTPNQTVSMFNTTKWSPIFEQVFQGYVLNKVSVIHMLPLLLWTRSN